MINKKYKLKQLEDAVKYCSLKYFIVDFEEIEYFKIKMQFPFLKYVINQKLTELEVENYFRDKKYTNFSIENESVKGDYFECSVKFGLKQYIKLPNEIKEEYTVDEIISMNKLEKSNFESEDEENENKDNGENNEELNAQKDSENKINENNENINKDITLINQKEINKLNEENFQNLNNLLKKFSIKENNKNNSDGNTSKIIDII